MADLTGAVLGRDEIGGLDIYVEGWSKSRIDIATSNGPSSATAWNHAQAPGLAVQLSPGNGVAFHVVHVRSGRIIFGPFVNFALAACAVLDLVAAFGVVPWALDAPACRERVRSIAKVSTEAAATLQILGRGPSDAQLEPFETLEDRAEQLGAPTAGML